MDERRDERMGGAQARGESGAGAGSTSGGGSARAARQAPGSVSSDAPTRPQRPGWQEVLVGLAAYGVGLVGTVALFQVGPEMDGATAGVVQYLISGGLGIIAFVVAYLVRIRRLDLLGVRRARPGWLLAGAGFGILTFLASMLIATVLVLILGLPENIQADYQSAARGGILALIATIAFGAVLTPIGEELFFRGVVANAFDRWRAWISVPVSALLFALAHGVNVVLPTALVVGLVTALLFRRTRSIWPGVMTHGMHNLLSVVVPLALGATVPE